MSREIDERIVAMYFDNKNFEKNAKTTINTLEELKENLDISKSAKGFETLQKAAEKLKLDDIRRKVSNLKDGFSGLSGVIGKAFDIGTAPLHSLHNLFDTFSGYVTRFVGYDLAGKLVGGLESAIRELTIAPVSAGWSEYELKMDSIKTIMSGTGESLDVVKDKLEDLNHYADKTIYSFSDMTSNIGKFTNSRVDLDLATSAIKGIANATADAGQGAQQASMAMYNASQALGVGSMKMIDWKSFENANIATSRLKETFIEAGVASGKLVREVKKDAKTGKEAVKYYVNDGKKGKKRTEVTVENFRETLQKDWLDKNTMLSTFKIYSGDITDAAQLLRMGFTEANGFTEEDRQRLLGIGEAAMQAATEVRTFTKMYDALKEAAQSGWASSLEYIFGDMEEGTSLWTKMNEKISGWLEESAERRNDALAQWRGLYKAYDGSYRRAFDLTYLEPETDEFGKIKARGERYIMTAKEDGRETLVNTFMELLDVIGTVGGAVRGAWVEVFGKLDVDRLLAITHGFRDFVNGLKDWLGAADDTNSRLGKITRGLKGVFGILKTVLNFAKSGFNLLLKIFKPLTDLAINLFARFGDFFEGIGEMKPGEALKRIGEGFTKLWDKIQHLDWGKVGEKFTNVWQNLKKTVKDWAYENGLGGVWEALSRWKANVQTAWNGLVAWVKSSGIADFFTNTWGWIMSLFGSGSKKDTVLEDRTAKPINLYGDKARFLSSDADIGSARNGASAVSKFLSEAWTTIQTTWETIVNWDGWQKISDFLSSTWAWIVTQFTPVAEGEPSPAGKFLSDAWTTIQTTWETIVNWDGWQKISDFLSSTWTWIVTQFTPVAEGEHSPVGQFLLDQWEALKGAWEDVKQWVRDSGIAAFLSDTWGWITSFFDSGSKPGTVADRTAVNKAIKPYGEAIRTLSSDADIGSTKGKTNTIAQFLLDQWEALKNAWEEVKQWVRDSGIAEFFNNTIGWITSLFSTGPQDEGTVEGGATSKAVESLQNIVKIAEGTDGAAEDTKGVEESVGTLERVLGALGTFWDKVTGFAREVGQNAVLGQVLDNITKLFEIAHKIITTIVDIVHSAVIDGDIGSWITIGVGAIVTIITKISSTRVKMTLAKAAGETESVGEMVMRIAAGIAIIAGVVGVLGALDKPALEQGIGSIIVIGILLAGVISVMNLTGKDSGVQQDKVTAWERLGQTLLKWVGIAGTISATLALLPAVFDSIKKNEVDSSAILTLFTGIIELIAGVGLSIAIISRIASDPLVMAKASLGVVAAIAIISAGLLTLFSGGGALVSLISDKGQILQSVQTFGEIMSSIGTAIGGFLVSFVTGGQNQIHGAYQDMESSNLAWAAEMAEEFTPGRLQALMRFTETLEKLGNHIPENTGKISDFANKLPELGTGLAKFAVSFRAVFESGGKNFDKAGEALSFVQEQVTLLTEMSDVIRSLIALQSTLKYNPLDPEIFTDANLDPYFQAAQRLAEAVQRGLSRGEFGMEGGLSFDATPITDAIVEALGYGSTAVAEAVHAMVQAGIDLSNNPQAAGEYNTGVIQQLMSGDLFGANGFNIENLWGNQGLGLDSLFGEGGLMGTLTSELNGVNADSLIALADEKLGGFTDDLQSKFTIPDLKEQMGNFFTYTDDGELDMDAMLGDFQEKMGTIGEELDNLGLEVTIKPVFDMTDIQSGIESINQYFRDNPIIVDSGNLSPVINVNIQNDTEIQSLKDINQTLVRLIQRVSAENAANMITIRNAGNQISSVAAAVRGMRIYLNTGALAGAVDQELGYTSFLAGRTGVFGRK